MGNNFQFVSIDVPDVNLPPLAQDDAARVQIGDEVRIQVLDNDYDPEGASLQVVSHGDAAHGSVSFSESGELIYATDGLFTGVDSFTYQVSDGETTSEATVNVTVVSEEEWNDAPQAIDDFIAVAPGASVSFNPLDNDIDDGEIFLRGVGDPEHGIISESGGILTYTPDEGFEGTDSVRYVIDDGEFASGATITFEVAVQNQAPVANDDIGRVKLGYDTNINLLGNDTDSEGDFLRLVRVSTEPQHGLVRFLEDGSAIYFSDGEFVGQDSFSYIVTDGVNESEATARVSIIAVEDWNEQPRAIPDFAFTTPDTAIEIDVLSNDVDEGPLSVTGFTNGSFGTVTQVGDNLIYTPNEGFTGFDSFTYSINDGELSSSGFVDVEVGVPNPSPIAIDDQVNTAPNTAVQIDVLANDIDDGEITVNDYGSPQNGSVSLGSDGTFTYTPDDGFVGTDSFEYVISDGNSDSVATVYVQVGEPVATVDAIDDVLPYDVYRSANFFPLNNDIGSKLFLSGLGDPEHGRVEIITFGGPKDIKKLGEDSLRVEEEPFPQTYQFRYTADNGYSGEDHFTYTISDGVNSDTATIYLNVADTGFSPTAQSDNVYLTTTNRIITFNPILNDTDPDGDTLILLGVGNKNSDIAVNWSYVSNEIQIELDGDFSELDGTLNYTTRTITYLVTDDEDLRPVEGTITVKIRGSDIVENTAPDALDDEAQTFVGQSVQIGVLKNDSDADNDRLYVWETGQGQHGSVELNSDGILTYTPDEEFTGEDSFTYVVHDGNDGFDTATVTVRVEPEIPLNTVPTAEDDDVEVRAGGEVAIDVLANDSDEDGDEIFVYSYAPAANGTVSMGSDLKLHYTPNVGFVGEDSFTYQITDGSDYSETATVTISVIDDTPPPLPFSKGDDVRDFSSMREGVELRGLTGKDTVTGSAFNDVIRMGAGSDFVKSGAGNDKILGSSDDDDFYGEDGDDSLTGGAGDDFLNGGADKDLIKGGDGMDVIVGGAGQDTLFGGAGADMFTFALGDSVGVRDVIKDFVVGEDQLDLDDVNVAKLVDGARGTLLILSNGEGEIMLQNVHGASLDQLLD